VIALLAPGSVLIGIGLFFTKLAVVTFGGAYAVLACMAQQAVSEKGWLTAGEMIDGLGLAETTPGPLILVTEFVDCLAGFGAGGMALGMAAAAVTLWMTLAPCFQWIFADAPYIARMQVGWLDFIWSDMASLNPFALGLTALAAVLLLRLKLGLGLVLAISAPGGPPVGLIRAFCV